MERWVGSGQARAPEHHLDVIACDIARDAAKQQVYAPAAIRHGNAGTPEFEDFSGVVDDAADVEFAGGIEAAAARSHLTADQPIRSDHSVIFGKAVINDEKMIADSVEFVEVPAFGALCRRGLGRHLFIEDLVAQALGRFDLSHGLGQPDLEGSRADRPKPAQICAKMRHFRSSWMRPCSRQTS